MSVAEMKKIIVEKVETLTEDQLVVVKQFVEAINDTPVKEYNLLNHVDEIVSDRADVLKRLAK